MFNFTTQTIFNNIVVSTNTNPVGNANVIVKDGKVPVLRVGNTRFSKDDVLDIQKKISSPENKAKVTFDLTKIPDIDGSKAGNYRILIYISLSNNSQDSFYQNDFVYTGKPFFIEFTVKNGEDMSTVATRIKKTADKYLLFMSQEAVMNITVDGTNVTFECVNGYQQIKVANIQKYEMKEITCCNYNNDYEDIIVGVPCIWTGEDDGSITVDLTKTMNDSIDGTPRNISVDTEVAIEPGIEAFCDYNWIIHNLRLPTCANTSFWAVTKPEMPSVGATYNQYIVRLCKKRDGIAGEVVGQRAVSVTTHVFYVNNTDPSLITAFETALKKVIDGEFKTDADDAFADPFHTNP